MDCRATRLAIVFAAATLITVSAADEIVGKRLPDWRPGMLDIHQISTGRGSCAFFILPDGTTMIVDAGELNGYHPRYAPARPDASRPAGEWLVRYIRRLHPRNDSPAIDYALLTHCHGDHMGMFWKKSPPSASGAYRLTGITWIGDKLPIRKLIDHGWPDYAYPHPHRTGTDKNYRAFVEWQRKHNGLIPQRFRPGRNDQVELVHQPDEYPGFEVRNIMANGEIWTGVGQASRRLFPESKKPDDIKATENMSSLGIRLRYGRFDYFTGGDIPGVAEDGQPAWYDVETPVAKVVGPVDVSVLNHHGYMDSQNAFFVSTLRPRVWIIPVWDSAHPTHRVWKRLQSTFLYPGPRDVFANNLHEASRVVVIGLDKLKSDRGHVVLRVEPGGEHYRVFILDDSAETNEVTAVHGPYKSR